MTALYAGSFSPPTLGHLDIIRRGASLFDVLLVAVLCQSEKQYPLTPESRADMIRRMTKGIPGVRVCYWDGLLVDLMRKENADVILRGVRDSGDMREELQIAQAHRNLAGYETIWLMSDPALSRLSSTIVRDCAAHHADLTGMVPEEIMNEIYAAYAK